MKGREEGRGAERKKERESRMGASVCVGEPQNINYCFSANGGERERERERLITGIY
jgi:hypothetical protein